MDRQYLINKEIEKMLLFLLIKLENFHFFKVNNNIFIKVDEKEKLEVIDKLNFLEDLFSDEKELILRLEKLNPL